ncbi:MAG: cytosine permease [Methanosphaera stadtmanae]|nr:cytosine permease [Methanosphaera stadtmanae]
MENKTGLFSNAVIWFGVAISVSEIQAGVQIGAMSPIKSLWLPLVLGHLLGGILLFLVGLIGARIRQNAMNTTKLAFGNYGSKFFATLNVMQLVAWVAVLYAQGALALKGLNLPISFSMTCIILASIVAVWVYIGLKRSSKITSAVMIILTLLLTILTVKLFTMGSYNTAILTDNMQALSFWNIFEISIAMPVSWLPVISDYTKDAEKPVKATLVSAVAYTIASLWMYFIGIEVVGIGANNDVAQAILLAGLGVTGIIILVLSTITTNFLATNSAGESAKTIVNSVDPKVAGIVVSALSAVIAISGIMDHFISFLYLITSVFGPMAAVLIVSYYSKSDADDNVWTWRWNIFAWFIGFIVYQLVSTYNSIFLGPTLLSFIVSAVLAYVRIILKK